MDVGDGSLSPQVTTYHQIFVVLSLVHDNPAQLDDAKKTKPGLSEAKSNLFS